MENIIDYQILEELTKVLEIEPNPEALESYFNGLDDSKFLDVFEKLKKKVGVAETVKYLNIITDFTGFNISSDLAEELLLDEGLQNFTLDSMTKKTNDKITSLLVKTINEQIEKEEQEMNDSNEESSAIGDLYTVEEEKAVFQKYKALKEELERYIFSHNFDDFIKYVNDIPTESKDSFIVKAMPKLYSYTCEDEPVVNIKKDKNVDRLVEELREIRDDIDIHNKRLVIKQAKKYASFGLPQADLEQEGRIGLCKGIEKFEVDYGNKFSTYATWWINQGITRILANEGNTIRFPVHIYEKRIRINKAVKILREQEGIEEPSDEDIFEKCQELGFDISMDIIKDRTRLELLGNTTSVDKNVGEDEDSSLIDFISSDDYEKPEDYAENRDMNDRTNQILDDIVNFKTSGRRNEVAKPPIVFKKLVFVTCDEKTITILLLKNEYDELVKKLNSGEKKTAFVEFLTKYKIDPNSLTSYLNVEDVVLTTFQREVLIFRYRTGLSNEFSDSFLNCRNYNGVFFEQGYDDSGELTLEKTGLLFGVTRERIRQIESKIRKKVELALGKRKNKDTREVLLYIGTKENIYNIFNICNNNEYVTIVKPNSVVTVNAVGDIIPLGEGKETIILKNVINGVSRELRVFVHEPIKISINAFVESKRKLKLELENKKDNQ